MPFENNEHISSCLTNILYLSTTSASDFCWGSIFMIYLISSIKKKKKNDPRQVSSALESLMLRCVIMIPLLISFKCLNDFDRYSRPRVVSYALSSKTISPETLRDQKSCKIPLTISFPKMQKSTYTLRF